LGIAALQSANTLTNPSESLLVSLIEAAEILGLKKSSVRRLIGRDELFAIRCGKGGKLFLSRASLLKFAARIQ
jgi:excisionase family DNA binding protein